MKNFYYFSKQKLKFVEIKNFKRKFFLIVFATSLLFTSISFGSYYLYNKFISPNAETQALISENKNLSKELKTIYQKYIVLNNRIDSLADVNNDLRLVNNLPVNDKKETVGIGGTIDLNFESKNVGELTKTVNEIESLIKNIEAKVEFEKNNYVEIENKFKYNQKLYDAIPAIKPADVRIGDGFGMRFHPVLKYRRMHYGLDFLANIGTPVYATGNGVVKLSKRYGGLGITVIINHGFGYETRYGHLKKSLVKVGQKIKRGDLIAYSGNTGRLSTGPHLHYEVLHNGVHVNPRNFIFENVKLFEIISKRD